MFESWFKLGKEKLGFEKEVLKEEPLCMYI